MYTRILTPLERRRAQRYLEENGEKTVSIQVLASRARSYLPQIRSDLAIIQKLVETYERTTAQRGWEAKEVVEWLEGKGRKPWGKSIGGKYYYFEQDSTFI